VVSTSQIRRKIDNGEGRKKLKAKRQLSRMGVCGDGTGGRDNIYRQAVGEGLLALEGGRTNLVN